MTASEEFVARLAALEEEVARLRAEVRCPRCSEPAPPEERWPGDARARDIRPPHSCGREPWCAVTPPEPREGFDVDELAPWEQAGVRSDWLSPICWPLFWTTDAATEDWLLEPVVAVGRQTAIYSTAKTGKSLLALDIAAAAATGRSVLGYEPRHAIDVVYVDLEMTEADLRERLTDLGYGPDDDLSRLTYYQLPALPPLDSELGGEILAAAAQERRASLVVIDTMARAVSGEENSADTYRNFYRCTGRRLKAAGIALLRLDHAGKDGALGQRGSSAKVDDVDIVFRLVQVDPKLLKLSRTHSRVPWVPMEVSIVRLEEPVLVHRQSEDAVPAGTHDAIVALDELGVPLDRDCLNGAGGSAPSRPRTAESGCLGGPEGSQEGAVVKVPRFREPQLSTRNRNPQEPQLVASILRLFSAAFAVPGTNGNHTGRSGSRFLPSLDGNRDQRQARGAQGG